ncbi:MAG TPA: hypothetical protein VFW83_01785, partial [Bryobacteraceae bacterium]|nr:hypothetical protein [Bryobacteraceae bacterium]
RILLTVALAAIAASCPLPAATVTGRIQLHDSKDAAVRKKKDFSGVVVWLEPVGAKAPLPKDPHARMIQKNKTFTPHVLAVPAGTTVDFPNFDPIFHNAFSNYDGQLFDIGLYPPGTSRSVRFARPGIVRVFCNIHATMSAVIAVLDTPYFDTTKKDGSYRIQGVPDGEYQLRIFHERAKQKTLEAASRRVSVAGSGTVMLPEIPISESGYLAIPHLNKFGRDYTPPPDDEGIYPAVRR